MFEDFFESAINHYNNQNFFEAKLDFTKCINLKKNSSIAYSNRGLMNYELNV